MALYFLDATEEQLQDAGFPDEMAHDLTDPWSFCAFDHDIKDFRTCSQLTEHLLLQYYSPIDSILGFYRVPPFGIDFCRLDELFTVKPSINDAQRWPFTPEVDSRVVDYRDYVLGGKFRSWRELESIDGIDPETLRMYQEQFSMPVSLSRATALQLRLCLPKHKAEWFVKQRETRGSMLLKVARIGSQPPRSTRYPGSKPHTGLGPLTVDDCCELMRIFSAPVMNLNEATSTDLKDLLQMSKANVQKILRLYKTREFTSWVDFRERMPENFVEKFDLDVFFALPSGIRVHQNYSLRKSFGANLEKVKEEVWKYRGGFDISSRRYREDLEYHEEFLELEHIIDIQLGELAWDRGPVRIFGAVVCNIEFMGKSIDMFNSVCNLNVTTRKINRQKGQFVKKCKDKDDAGPVENPRLIDYSGPFLWLNSEREMKKSFDHMFDLTFSTVGKAADFDRSEMLQRWKDPKMKLEKRAQIAFLEELHKVLQEMLGYKF